nr:hypothetical protein [Tanacetum cinerariifolium]
MAIIVIHCEGPLRGGFCFFCATRSETSFANDPNPNSFNDFQNLSSPQPQCETYSCELCRNDSHYGYDCPPQFPFVYKKEPSYNQNDNDNNYPYNSPSFLCCDNCEGPHATFQCQPMNQNINSSNFDQIQPLQYPVIHHPSQEMCEEILQAKENLMKSIQTFLKKFNRISFREMPKVLSQAWEKFFEIQHAQLEDTNKLLQELLEDLQIISEELVEYINSSSWNLPTFYNNDEEHYIQYKKFLENSSKAIATVLPTKEPEYSISMGDEHLSTIPETESDELIKSSVENLVPTPSESEDVPMENFKVYSNPLFDDEEILSNKIDPHYFNAESNLIESLPNQDTLFDYSPKFDYLEELSGELMPTSIINEERIKREHEEYISLMEKLLTINSFPRPLENFHVNTIIKTLPTSPIPVEDSDSFREEIDIFIGTDDLISSGIERNDYDSKEDIHFLKELLRNDSILLLKNKSSEFDHYDEPSFPCSPPEPPDDEGVKTSFLTPTSPLRAGGISSDGTFMSFKV